jgi:hypothetical protein
MSLKGHIVSGPYSTNGFDLTALEMLLENTFALMSVMVKRVLSSSSTRRSSTWRLASQSTTLLWKFGVS